MCFFYLLEILYLCGIVYLKYYSHYKTKYMTNQEIKNKVTNHLKNNLFFTFLNYKIDYAVGMALAEIVYDGYFAGERNMSEISKKNLKSKIGILPISDDQKENFDKDL